MRTVSCALVAGAVALAFAAGCGGGGTATTATSQAPSTATSTTGGAARGEALATSKGCRSCHTTNGSPSVGPTWKGLAGSQVTLADGSTVTADDQYLLAAIEDPDKQIVKGFRAGVMSGTIPKGSISSADAKALVAYIKTLG